MNSFIKNLFSEVTDIMADSLAVCESDKLMK